MHKPRPFRLTAPPPLKEADVKRACLDLLRLRGYYVQRTNSGLFKTPDGRWIRIGEVGVPDYVATHQTFPGFLMELKRPGGDVSPEQKTRIMEIRLGYHLAIAVVDTVEALDVWLRQHEARNKSGAPV